MVNALIRLDRLGNGFIVTSGGVAIGRLCGLSFAQCFMEMVVAVWEGLLSSSRGY